MYLRGSRENVTLRNAKLIYRVFQKEETFLSME